MVGNIRREHAHHTMRRAGGNFSLDIGSYVWHTYDPIHLSGVMPMNLLTEHQRKIMVFILKHHELYGFPPTIREIASEFHLKSPRTVSDYLLALQRKGHIKVHTGKKRGIEILKGLPTGIPIVGRIAAGSPIIAEENVEDFLNINPGLFTTESCFAVRVKGDSMTGAGILDGDCVIIKKQEHAENGQIVAALIGDEVTIKRYKYTERGVLLLPENPAYEPIYLVDIGQERLILGILVGLLRKI